jgi:kinetochore protein Mis13/DSN1
MEEPEPEPPRQRRQQQQETGQKRKTRTKVTDNTANSTPNARPQRKTSKQNSVEPTTAEESEEPRRTRRKVAHSDPASGKTKKKKSKVDDTREPERMRDVEVNGNHTPQEKEGNATTIALPFADTPVISKNKEMRQGKGKSQRRSSLGMRGRRASSLIDSGVSNGEIRCIPGK